ncbi:hypothetical protein SPE26_09405 [Bacillus thuringiensis]|uniref:Phage tail protein n=1 Tax=Bacillus thuringiensis TaxID=1428 RepID=A0AAW9GGC9_BACTU|nr:hypothetical protein [Bacillus thuringiensis]MDA2091454.1 hypothetical protein [Bacillus cereus]MDY0851232.1 hypothetical protein [Bacillus thuringiensis]MDY4390979.1 hypothetical protein [Bacillus thuringiensis]MDY7961506.1 hypothetical protein [Bacillus thuringiensis]
MSQFDKFNSKNKKMIIKGAGKFMAKIPGCDELITLGHMANMRLDVQLDMVDIEGGDSSAPIDTLLRKKVIDITAEDAKFDLNMVRLVLGAKLREGVSGLAYELKNETVTIAGDTEPVSIKLSSPVLTGSGAPKVQIFNQVAGSFVPESAITVNGSAVTLKGGAVEGDTVVVYYPVASSSIDPDGFVWVLEERHDVKGGLVTLKNPLFGGSLGSASSKTEHVSVRLVKENKLLKKVTTNPAKGEYTIDPSTGEIKFNDYLEGEQIYVNYKRPEVVDVMAIGSRDFPLTVSVVHDGHFEQMDGSIQGYQVELYSCRVKSNFTLDTARQTAATHSITLTVIDGERTDSRLGSIKRYQIEKSSDVC